MRDWIIWWKFCFEGFLSGHQPILDHTTILGRVIFYAPCILVLIIWWLFLAVSVALVWAVGGLVIFILKLFFKEPPQKEVKE